MRFAAARYRDLRQFLAKFRVGQLKEAIVRAMMRGDLRGHYESARTRQGPSGQSAGGLICRERSAAVAEEHEREVAEFQQLASQVIR